MAAPVPSLSSDGWINDIARKTDRLLSYFFVSEESQSNIYDGQIASLPGLIREYGNRPLDLKSQMREALINMLKGYYDSVDVSVSVSTENTQIPGRADVTVTITVTENGKSYQVPQLVQTLNGKLLNIINLNNNG